MNRVVIALGGNSVLEKGERPTFKTQFSHISKAAADIAEMLFKHNTDLVITHGNGPQVGDELLRNEIARRAVPKLPLFSLNAETQAFIGSMIEIALRNAFEKTSIKKDVIAVLTHAIVEADDPAFRSPSKPVGPFFTKMELKKELKLEKFSYVAENGGYRKVVPSPVPKKIAEIDAISKLLDDGKVVIAGGGGGVPVYMEGRSLVGANAVVDKDYEARIIANGIGADEMVILTGVDYVYADFPENRRGIKSVKVSEIKKILERFEKGTMGPKVRACVDFIENGGSRAYIGSLFRLNEVIEGISGTTITR
jgi:carbamate kinase